MGFPPALIAALAAGVVLALGLLARALRGRGDLVVVIDYEAPRAGSFDVKLARRRLRGASWRKTRPNRTRSC